ncbi:hypothetical protein JTB14_011420 [Gonioctena quinquepunctata]|nr:hypothetical protein JTB14_011420 [Gonioctena quinquepunctata]
MNKQMDSVFNYNLFFNGNLCHVCKKQNETLKTCSTCKAIAYCSREHQKIDWKKHKELCSIISNTNHLFDNFSVKTYEDFVKMKKTSYLLLKKKLQRNLYAYEEQMCMSPRVCEFCFFRKVTTYCEICRNVSYCSEEHKKSHRDQHKKHCEELKLSLELDLKSYYSELSSVDVTEKDFSNSLKVLPNSLNDLIHLYDDSLSISKDDIEIIRKSELIAPAATILYGMEASGFLIDRTYLKNTLTIHIVGADVNEMSLLWKIMSELPFHWVRNLKSLEYIVIGPELGHNGTTEKFKNQLCFSCKLREAKTRCTFHTQLYHNIVDMLEKPDLVVVFNSGLHEFKDDPKNNLWKDSIPSLLKYPGIPLILTAYTSDEIAEDIALLEKDISNVKVISPPHRNPFSNMRPLKNFDSQNEPVYYLNGHIAVLLK